MIISADAFFQRISFCFGYLPAAHAPSAFHTLFTLTLFRRFPLTASRSAGPPASIRFRREYALAALSSTERRFRYWIIRASFAALCRLHLFHDDRDCAACASAHVLLILLEVRRGHTPHCHAH